jgi:hypothetical protein
VAGLRHTRARHPSISLKKRRARRFSSQGATEGRAVACRTLHPLPAAHARHSVDGGPAAARAWDRVDRVVDRVRRVWSRGRAPHIPRAPPPPARRGGNEHEARARVFPFFVPRARALARSTNPHSRPHSPAGRRLKAAGRAWRVEMSFDAPACRRGGGRRTSEQPLSLLSACLPAASPHPPSLSRCPIPLPSHPALHHSRPCSRRWPAPSPAAR